MCAKTTEALRVHALLIGAASAPLIAWIVLALGRGGFWRTRYDTHVVRMGAGADPRASVYAVVPARNEAEYVGTAITSLAEQRYNGTLRIFLVDDQSDDETVAFARAAAAHSAHPERLEIVQATPPPPGWSGKLNALECGVRAAQMGFPLPDYWLFTDADIRHDPDNVRTLIEKARRERIALLSLMVRLRCSSVWERLLIPAFVFFFQKLYPFAWANDPARKTAAAAGGCVLLTHDALARIGGLHVIRERLIDDCSLAAAVKATGGATWLGLTDRTTSTRRYESLSEIWAMVKRTAYTQLNHSPALLMGAIAGMLLLYVAPVVGIIVGLSTHDPWIAALSVAALGLIVIVYRPTVLAYHLDQAWALTLPLAAALYTAITVDSALAHAQKRGGLWKGRYDPVA